MPAYNSEKWIANAIQSILNQTFKDFEFIIIDDASTDNTLTIIKDLQKIDPRITILENTINSGVSVSRNRGIEISNGQFIACMDSDDWSYPDRFEKQLAVMEANSGVMICGSSIEICSANLTRLNLRKYPLMDRDIRKKIFKYSPFAHPSTMFRAEALKTAKGYDENLTFVEDYDLYFRLGKQGLFANIPDVLHKLRMHSTSLSQATGKKVERQTLQIRKKAIFEYGYRMTMWDKLYFIIQSMSLYILPYRIKFWLFNWLRSLSK